MYGASHVVVVPTRAEFPEGFNQVLAEAVISGKPVITSSVCPALEVVKEAAVEVPPDDVEAYGDAILRLYEDSALYAEKQNACPTVRERNSSAATSPSIRSWNASSRRSWYAND